MLCAFCLHLLLSSFFFFNDTATTEIYTLSLHDALPIFCHCLNHGARRVALAPVDRVLDPHRAICAGRANDVDHALGERSEEHTSELQSRLHLVCRLLLEKKKNKTTKSDHHQATQHHAEH